MEKSKSPKNERQDKNKEYSPATFTKSNVLIRAKFKSSLLEDRLIDYALITIQKNGKLEDGLYKVSFNTRPLQDMMGMNGNSYFYTKIKSVAKAMLGRQIFIEYVNPETGEPVFAYYNLINKATYADGVFSVYFNGTIPLKNIEKAGNYTKLSYEAKWSLKNIYSVRLYEILKSVCYVPKGEAKRDHFVYEIGLAELQLEIGVVNAEIAKVREILSRDVVDYELAVRTSPEKVNVDWSKFKERVLDPAIKEINGQPKAKMQIHYDKITAGKGGKVIGIRFYVDVSGVVPVPLLNEQLPVMSQEDRFKEIVYVVNELNKVGILDVSMESAAALAEKCMYDHERLQKALFTYESATNKVENPIGYMLDYLEKEYTLSRKQLDKFRQVHGIGQYGLNNGGTEEWGDDVKDMDFTEIWMTSGEGQKYRAAAGDSSYTQLSMDFPFEMSADDE